MVVAAVVATAVSVGTTIYEGTKQQSIANSQLAIEHTQQQKQDMSFNQLQQLLSDPNSFFTGNTAYTAAFNQGTQAVSRAGAAQGLNSTSGPIGGQATALQQFGQSFGSSQLLSQEQLLAGMSGTGFNAASAGSAASSSSAAGASSLNSLAGTLSFLGNGGGGMFGSATPDATTTSNAVAVGNSDIAAGEGDWLAGNSSGGIAGFSMGGG